VPCFFGWQKLQHVLTEWSWIWVFWPYWMLASICIAIAAWATCRMLGTSDADALKQSSALRVYNIGFFLLLTLPLTGALYLDGLLSDEAVYVPPVRFRGSVLAFLHVRIQPEPQHASNSVGLLLVAGCRPVCNLGAYKPIVCAGIGDSRCRCALPHAHISTMLGGRR
jgi:hypothetical protein